MTASTRVLVDSLTRSCPCTTRDTVAVDTPAMLATSYNVTTLPTSRLAWRIAVAPIAGSHGAELTRSGDTVS